MQITQWYLDKLHIQTILHFKYMGTDMIHYAYMAFITVEGALIGKQMQFSCPWRSICCMSVAGTHHSLFIRKMGMSLVRGPAAMCIFSSCPHGGDTLELCILSSTITAFPHHLAWRFQIWCVPWTGIRSQDCPWLWAEVVAFNHHDCQPKFWCGSRAKAVSTSATYFPSPLSF